MLIRLLGVTLLSLCVVAFLTSISRIQIDLELTQQFRSCYHSNQRIISNLDKKDYLLFKTEIESQELKNTKNGPLQKLSELKLNTNNKNNLLNAQTLKEWFGGHKCSSFIEFLSILTLSPPLQA